MIWNTCTSLVGEEAPAEPNEANNATGFAKNKSTWGVSDERRKTWFGKLTNRDERLSSWGAKELDFVIQTEDYVKKLSLQFHHGKMCRNDV